MNRKKELLESYPAQADQIVRWGDMDALNHVNNIMYFRYFEAGRLEYLAKCGFDFKATLAVGPVLGETTCQFIIPVTFPDTLTVAIKVVDVKPDRITMEQVIYSEQHDAIAAKGSAVMVWFDYKKGCKAALSDEVIAAIQLLEKN